MRTGAGLSECSFVGVLSRFALEQDLESGERVHDLLIKYGFDCESGHEGKRSPNFIL